MGEADDAETSWTVLVNDEGQHAFWPEFKPLPSGWREAGFSGSEADCVAYVDAHWTDMRPMRLR